MDSQVVTFTYTNWQGETAQRTVRPIHMYFGHTTYHQGDQWLLVAYDLDKKAERTFAMKDISGWKPVDTNEKTPGVTLGSTPQ